MFVSLFRMVCAFTCIVALSSALRVHWATAGKAWHTSISDRGGLVFRTTVVKISIAVCSSSKNEINQTALQPFNKIVHTNKMLHTAQRPDGILSGGACIMLTSVGMSRICIGPWHGSIRASSLKISWAKDATTGSEINEEQKLHL